MDQDFYACTTFPQTGASTIHKAPDDMSFASATWGWVK